MKGKVKEVKDIGNKKQFLVTVEGSDLIYKADGNIFANAGIDLAKECPKVGDEIFFGVGKQQGIQVTINKILNEDVLSREDCFEKFTLPLRNVTNNTQYFSNPYNFVPVIEPSKDKLASFKRPFVSHEKFEGVSGIITCRLKTLTPFFTSDTHSEDEISEHKKLDFFSFDKKSNTSRLPAVSGSTLRGVVRSVCEAISNSTFTAVSSEILDYRALNQASKLKCGRIVVLPTENAMGEIQLLKSAKLPINLIPSNVKDSHEGWANLESLYSDGKFLGKIVVDAQADFQANYTHGYFKLTGENLLLDENGKSQKSYERFFYEDGNSQAITFSLEEVKKYNHIIGNQNETARKSLQSDSTNIVAKDICERRNHPLAIGHLVYFQPKDQSAVNLGYVSIPRWQYEQAIHQKLETQFHPPEDANSLCPTSRIFGFVRDKKISKKKDNEGKSSYAGRVYFSDAKFDLTKRKVKYDENIVLEILSSPKPTTREFYLTGQSDPADVWIPHRNGQKKEHKGYNEDNITLRGRKFYWHQEDKGQYRRRNNEVTSQNSTLKMILAKDNEFVFLVRFENLEEHELGLLLWGLALQDGMAHKAGMGKPLGLGSIEITIDSLKIIARETRYQKFFQDDGKLQEGISVQSNWRGKYVTKFTEWMTEHFGKPFDDLENVKALQNILHYPNSSPHPIHYPLRRNSDDKSYEWFKENRVPDSVRYNRSQVLPYPIPAAGIANDLKRN